MRIIKLVAMIATLFFATETGAQQRVTWYPQNQERTYWIAETRDHQNRLLRYHVAYVTNEYTIKYLVELSSCGKGPSGPKEYWFYPDPDINYNLARVTDCSGKATWTEVRPLGYWDKYVGEMLPPQVIQAFKYNGLIID